jgi:hypothetical protein
VAAPCDAPPGIDADRYARVMALNDYLFNDLRFIGNSTNYEDPRNSCLNEVLDRRTGIPITLALLYIEVARRAGLDVQGVNFPGHFLLRCPAGRNEPYSADLIIDAFHGGALLSADACQELLRRHQGSPDETVEPRHDPVADAAEPEAYFTNGYPFCGITDVTEAAAGGRSHPTDEPRPWPLTLHVKASCGLEAYLHGAPRRYEDERQEEMNRSLRLRRRLAMLN